MGFEVSHVGLETHLKTSEAKLEAILAKKTFTKDDKEAIRSILSTARQSITENMPFLIDSFREATVKTVTSAKAEIDAFLTHNTLLAGMKELFKSKGDEPKALPPGDEKLGSRGDYTNGVVPAHAKHEARPGG